MDNKEKLVEYLTTNGKKEGESWEQLAKKYGFENGEQARARWKKARKDGLPFMDAGHASHVIPLETVERFIKANTEKGTIESTTESSFEPKNDIELAELHNIDLSKYKISSYWSKLKSNGKFTSSVFATAKKPEELDLQRFTDFLSTYVPSPVTVTLSPSKREKDDAEVEISIADFHLDRLTLVNDSIGKRMIEYMNVLYELIDKALNSFNVTKWKFILGNDFFNTDNFQGTTTNGTPQSVSVSWNEAYEKGFKLMVNVLSVLKATSIPVDVILVQGNHGRTKEYYLAHALEAFFKDEPSITFDRVYSTTKFTVCGNTFIGYHHGNTKIDDLPLLFATSPDSAEAFGKAKFREVHTADKHHYLAKEVKGVRIQQIPCMVNPDVWSTDNNYVNNIRAALALVYHPTKGKIAEFEARI